VVDNDLAARQRHHRPAGHFEPLIHFVTLSSQPTVWLKLLGETPSYMRRVRANYLACGQDT
jgi:hypothetical protein